MQTPKLKLCPFCGGEAQIIHIRASYDDYDYDGIAMVVKCKRCGAVSPYKRGTMHGNFRWDERDKAADAWNRRAGDET